MHLELRLVQTARCPDHSTGTSSPTTTSSSSVAPATRTIARVLLLSPVVDALVVVQAVQRAKHLVAQIADGIVQRLQVLLLLVSLQRELGAQQFAADIAPMAGGKGQRQGDPARAMTRHYMGAARGIAVYRGGRLLAHNTAEDARGATLRPQGALQRDYVQTVNLADAAAAAALVVMMAVVLLLVMMMMMLL